MLRLNKIKCRCRESHYNDKIVIRPSDVLFLMEIPKLVRQHFYTEIASYPNFLLQWLHRYHILTHLKMHSVSVAAADDLALWSARASAATTLTSIPISLPPSSNQQHREWPAPVTRFAPCCRTTTTLRAATLPRGGRPFLQSPANWNKIISYSWQYVLGCSSCYDFYSWAFMRNNFTLSK